MTPGCYTRVVVAEDDATAERIALGSLLLRFIALTGSAEAFMRHGHEHPLGAGVVGLTSFVPTGLGRRESLAPRGGGPGRRGARHAHRGQPGHASPDGWRRSSDAGARHLQIVNMTPLADPSQAAASERLLAEALQDLRRAAANL